MAPPRAPPSPTATNAPSYSPAGGAARSEEDLETALGMANDIISQMDAKVKALEASAEEANAMRAQAARLGEKLTAARRAARERGFGDDADLCADDEIDDDVDAPSGDGWAGAASLVADARSGGWLVRPDDVVLGAEIGRGSSGVTHRAMWRGAPVACKIVDVSSPGRAATFLREVRVQSRTRHPNVLPFYGARVDPPDRCWILTTLCHGGTLKQWLYPKGVDNGTKRPLAARLRIAHELARALRCLEESSPRLIHRDVKPSNLFMSSDADDATAYLADFGLAREIRGGEADATEARETLNSNPNSSSPPPKPSSEDVMTGETGTYVYMAPEVVRHERYDAKADVYSFGATLVELVNGAPPYREYFQTPVQIAFAVADGKLRPELKAAASRACPGIAAVAQECVARDPSSRPSFAKIVDAFDAMLPEVLAALEKGSKDASGGGISAMFKGLFG